MIDSVSDSAGANADLKKSRQKSAQADTRKVVDQLPPHSIEAEQGVIGCLLAEPAGWLPMASTLNKTIFYDLRHQTIFSTLAAMYRAGTPVDTITVQSELRKAEMLDQCGGVAYLCELQDGIPSTANFPSWLDIIREKYELRRVISVCADVQLRAMTNGVPLDDLKFSIQSDLGEVFGGSTGGLPEIIDSTKFMAAPLPLPPELIQGLLHKGSKLALGGSSKSFKTWTLLDLALSVSHGQKWLGRETITSKVLYVNFEIQDHVWQRRIEAVAHSKGIALSKDSIHLWNLRGHAADYRSLIPKIAQRTRSENYSLIILDPIYKLYGSTDENAAGDVAELLNSMERLAVDTGAAIAFGTHFAKGNASTKEAIDRISGSGVFARDPDTLLIFTKHEEQDAFSVEPILRNFAPVEPFVVRWNYPTFEIDSELDPDKLKLVAARTKNHLPEDLLNLIPDDGIESQTLEQKASENGISRATYFRLRKDLEYDQKVLFSKTSSKWVKILPKNTFPVS
jgi:hypothetical protein